MLVLSIFVGDVGTDAYRSHVNIGFSDILFYILFLVDVYSDISLV